MCHLPHTCHMYLTCILQQQLLLWLPVPLTGLCPCCCRHTQVPHEMIHELLQDMAPRYRPQDYSLLWHNCNHFSNELAMLLTGEGIPVRAACRGHLSPCTEFPACSVEPLQRSSPGPAVGCCWVRHATTVQLCMKPGAHVRKNPTP
jgi:hypothetical protein